VHSEALQRLRSADGEAIRCSKRLCLSSGLKGIDSIGINFEAKLLRQNVANGARVVHCTNVERDGSDYGRELDALLATHRIVRNLVNFHRDRAVSAPTNARPLNLEFQRRVLVLHERDALSNKRPHGHFDSAEDRACRLPANANV
jgi:hypothetical protein